MYYVYNKNSDILIDFDNNYINGTCNYTQKTIENIQLPEDQVYDHKEDKKYAKSFDSLIKFTEPFKGKEETDNWIILINYPNIKITTDIKLKKEVESNA